MHNTHTKSDTAGDAIIKHVTQLLVYCNWSPKHDAMKLLVEKLTISAKTKVCAYTTSTESVT